MRGKIQGAFRGSSSKFVCGLALTLTPTTDDAKAVADAAQALEEAAEGNQESKQLIVVANTGGGNNDDLNPGNDEDDADDEEQAIVIQTEAVSTVSFSSDAYVIKETKEGKEPPSHEFKWGNAREEVGFVGTGMLVLATQSHKTHKGIKKF